MCEWHSHDEQVLVEHLDRFLEAATDSTAVEKLIRDAEHTTSRACSSVLRSLRDEVHTIARLKDDPLARRIGIRPGVCVRKHVVIGLLGRGGLGIVFLAVSLNPARKVALKIMQPDPAGSSRNDAFRTEMEAMAGLPIHPFLAPLFGCGEYDGHLFFTMERLPGRTVRDFVCDTENRATSPGRRALEHEVARFGVQCAEGLATLHDSGLLHNDVSSGNIAMTTMRSGNRSYLGDARIFDFGLASDVDGRDPPRWCNHKYAAPERLYGMKPDRSSDLYSLGLVLIEMLAGRNCRFGTKFGPAADPLLQLSRRPHRYLVRILHKATRSAPGPRYQNARELVADLERFLAGDRPECMPDRKVMNAFHHLKRHAWRNLVAATAAGALGFALWVSPKIAAELRFIDRAEASLRSADLRDLAVRRAGLESTPKRWLLSRGLAEAVDRIQPGSKAPIREIAQALADRREADAVRFAAIAVRDHGLESDELLARWIANELDRAARSDGAATDTIGRLLAQAIVMALWERPRTANLDNAATEEIRRCARSGRVQSRSSVQETATWILLLGAVGRPSDAVELLECAAVQPRDSELHRAAIEAAGQIVRRWHQSGRTQEIPIAALWSRFRDCSSTFYPKRSEPGYSPSQAYGRVAQTLASAGRSHRDVPIPEWLFLSSDELAELRDDGDRLWTDRFLRAVAGDESILPDLFRDLQRSLSHHKTIALARTIGAIDHAELDLAFLSWAKSEGRRTTELIEAHREGRSILEGRFLGLSIAPNVWMGAVAGEPLPLLDHPGTPGALPGTLRLDFSESPVSKNGSPFVARSWGADLLQRESNVPYLCLEIAGHSALELDVDFPGRPTPSSWTLDLLVQQAARPGLPFEGVAELVLSIDNEIQSSETVPATMDVARSFSLPASMLTQGRHRIRIGLGPNSTTAAWLKRIEISECAPR